MKEGNYCLYKNNIYDYSIDFDGNSFVSTTDKSIIDDSFAGPNMRGFYKKKVNISELDDDYAVFRERYVKIRVYLENLHKAYVNKTLDNTRICLDIVRMIDHGDDDELQDAIAAVNRYYQENIYEE